MTRLEKVPLGQAAVGTRPWLDVEAIRRDFPILGQAVNGKPLVYLDNAATSQKPRAVIEAMSRYYETSNANVHRGVHSLSQSATEQFERARRRVQEFIAAPLAKDIIFVRGTTEAINLVARSFAASRVSTGDEILVTGMEHHSNIVPWQMLCSEKGAHLKVVPFDSSGELLLDEYERLLGPKTRLVALTHVSNALGTINPVNEMIRLAHRKGIPVLLDGAQAVPHMKVDVSDLDCDFYCFSAHKMFGPTGIGVLYGKTEWLESMPPYQGGGEMIASVTFEKTVYSNVPNRFEAGTPDIAGVIGLGAAIDYLEGVGMEAIWHHDRDLLEYATTALQQVPGLRIVGQASSKTSVVSFTLEGVHPHDIGTILDLQGVAIRTGHHCAQPAMEALGIPATARVSFALYNTRREIDALVSGILRVKEVFG